MGGKPSPPPCSVATERDGAELLVQEFGLPIRVAKQRWQTQGTSQSAPTRHDLVFIEITCQHYILMAAFRGEDDRVAATLVHGGRFQHHPEKS